MYDLNLGTNFSTALGTVNTTHFKLNFSLLFGHNIFAVIVAVLLLHINHIILESKTVDFLAMPLSFIYPKINSFSSYSIRWRFNWRCESVKWDVCIFNIENQSYTFQFWSSSGALLKLEHCCNSYKAPKNGQIVDLLINY